MSESEIVVRWSDESDDVNDIVRFFVKNTDTSYISHGEIMDGRAVSSEEWSTELEEVLAVEFGELLGEDDEQEPRLLVVTKSEKLLALAVIEFLPRTRRPFGVLHDLVVHREYRERGIGSQLISMIEEEAAEAGLGKLFLECGIANSGAHEFWGTLGYEVASQTRIKRLGDSESKPT
ncbi:MAG: GNAT superfamily N-acetyltransferase [Planctomycetota bacterium]|jgi:GNAT superfamily N-acetyltransferase